MAIRARKVVITTIKVPCRPGEFKRRRRREGGREDSIFLCFIHGPWSRGAVSPCPQRRYLLLLLRPPSLSHRVILLRFCVISTEKAHNQIVLLPPPPPPQNRNSTEAGGLHCIGACSWAAAATIFSFEFPEENKRFLDGI